MTQCWWRNCASWPAAGPNRRPTPLLRLVLPALRADYRLLEDYTYVPGAGLDCPVLALVGDRDPRVTVDAVVRWEGETRAGFAMQILPGSHFFVDDHLPYLAETIGSRLWQPAGPGPTAQNASVRTVRPPSAQQVTAPQCTNHCTRSGRTAVDRRRQDEFVGWRAAIERAGSRRRIASRPVRRSAQQLGRCPGRGSWAAAACR